MAGQLLPIVNIFAYICCISFERGPRANTQAADSRVTEINRI